MTKQQPKAEQKSPSDGAIYAAVSNKTLIDKSLIERIKVAFSSNGLIADTPELHVEIESILEALK